MNHPLNNQRWSQIGTMLITTLGKLNKYLQMKIDEESKPNKLKVYIKKVHEDAVVPEYAKPGDAGLDLYCTERGYDDCGNIVYYTGLAMQIPEGYVGLLFPRSSVSKHCLTMANSVGVIDSGYRGEILLKFRNLENPDKPWLFTEGKVYDVGERVAQIVIMPYPQVEFQSVKKLSDSERGDGGFGSTGR